MTKLHLLLLRSIPAMCLLVSCSTTNAESTLKDDGTCESVAGRDISEPKIQIFRVKEKAPASEGRYRLSGSVEGVCLADAGYYENGRMAQAITIRKTRSFERFEFELEVSLEDGPEVRAKNVMGQSVTAQVKAAKTDAEWQESYQDRYHGLREQ